MPLNACIITENMVTPKRKKKAPNALSTSDRGLISPKPMVVNVVNPKYVNAVCMYYVSLY